MTDEPEERREDEKGIKVICEMCGEIGGHDFVVEVRGDEFFLCPDCLEKYF